VHKIKPGSTHNLADTTAFLELLNQSDCQKIFSSSNDVIVTRAPGRLDLMGGIADYSGSLVLQFPIANATHVALQTKEERTIRITSLQDNRKSFFEMPLSDFFDKDRPIDYTVARERLKNNWAAYIVGAFLVLMRERGTTFNQGANILVSSSVPLSKGVSSSASLEVAVMTAVAAAFDIEISAREVAFLCQKVENLIVGAPCGIMDQMSVACGAENELLELLCQPAEVKGTIKLPDELAVWGIDSGIRHSVGGADYGTVRTAAFMGYRILAENDVRWNGYLANITTEEFENYYAARLPKEISGAEFLEKYKGITDSVTTVNPEKVYPVYHATRHPIYENYRVNKFAEILKNWRGLDEAKTLGELMYESHESYSACGLGSDGTDELVALVREEENLFGAKITGGGSGGTVAVLGKREASQEIKNVVEKYATRTGYEPIIISGSSPSANAFGHLRLAV
jgi:L-arabinokinase